MTDKTKLGVALVLGVGFAAIGVTHFTTPETYVEIVPDYLPAHLALVYVSGVFEILGGLGLLVPATRPWAGYMLVALLIAVFPANIHMAVKDLPFMGRALPPAAHIVRLPFQFVLMGLVLWCSNRR